MLALTAILMCGQTSVVGAEILTVTTTTTVFIITVIYPNKITKQDSKNYENDEMVYDTGLPK